MHDFDSLNQQLNALNNKLDQSTTALYDSFAKKYTETSLEGFRKIVTDHRKYLQELKSKFIQSCGDPSGQHIPAGKEDDYRLTNTFFLDFRGQGKTLFYQLAEVQRAFSSHNNDPKLDDQISKMIEMPGGEDADAFCETYFHNVSPVAAVTILSKFESNIILLEKKVLQNLLKNRNVTPK